MYHFYKKFFFIPDKESIQTFTFDAPSRKIHVGEDVGIVKPFQILGFVINGQILDANDKPLANIDFDLLESKSNKKLGSTKSTSDGAITFKGVAVGDYKIALSPALSGKIELFENEQTIQIGHENAHLKDFKIKSFTVHGKVVAGKKSLSGAKILVKKHDQKTAEIVSDKDGNFILKGVSKGPLTLNAVLEGYDFEVQTLEKIHPGMVLPALAPTRYRYF